MGKGFVALVTCLTMLATAATNITSTARADILCQDDNLDTLKARPGPDCPAGETKIDPVTLGLQGPAGPEGPVGPKGADGARDPRDPRALPDRRAPTALWDPRDPKALPDRRAPTALWDPRDPKALPDRRAPTALWDPRDPKALPDRRAPTALWDPRDPKALPDRRAPTALWDPRDPKALPDRRAPTALWDPRDPRALPDRRAPTALWDPRDPRALSDRRAPTGLWDPQDLLRQPAGTRSMSAVARLKVRSSPLRRPAGSIVPEGRDHVNQWLASCSGTSNPECNEVSTLPGRHGRRRRHDGGGRGESRHGNLARCVLQFKNSSERMQRRIRLKTTASP